MLKEKLLKMSAEYQNIRIKGTIIQAVFFLIKYLLKIPVLSAFGLVQCKLFRNFILNFLQQQTNNKKNEKMQAITSIVLITYLISLMILTITFIKFKNSNKLKIRYGMIMIIQIFNNIGGFFLIKIFILQTFIIFKGLSILLIIITQIPMLLLDKIFISYQGHKTNIFSHKNNQSIFILNIIEKLVFFITVSLILFESPNQNIFINIFYLLLTFIYSFKIYLYIIQKYYIDDLSHLLQTSGTSACLILLVLINFYEVTQEPLLLSNFLPLCVIVGLFSLISIYLFFKYMSNEYLLMSFDEITSRELVLPYLSSIYKLWREQDSVMNSYLISSFRKNHEISCIDPSCKCKKHDQLKNQEANIIFLRNYLQGIFKSLTYIKDKDIVLQILFLRLEMFEEKYSINQKVKQMKMFGGQLSISTQAGLQILTKKLEIKLSEQNSQTLSIDVLSIINLQQRINEIQKIILHDIRIKKHKWNYLCQHICKSLQIQEDIVQQIKNIINFQNIYHENKLNYQQNLAFNTLSLFYYGSIVFLKKQIPNIIKNIHQLTSLGKYHFLSAQKQLENNLFHHKCCLLQFDMYLEDDASQQMQLTIVNCNNNVNNVFKCQKSKLIGLKAQKLFPEFLREDMSSLLNKHFQSKHFSSRVNNFFYVDSLKHVFEGITCIKILPRNQTIECIFFILKKQTQNLILLNSQGRIQNVSPAYIDIFSNFYSQVPFSALFVPPEDYQDIRFRESDQKKNLMMIDAMVMKQGWQNYLENSIKYVKNKQLKSFLNFQSRVNFEIRRQKYYQYYQFLKNQRRELINLRKKETAKSINKSHERQPKTVLSLLGVTMIYKKCKLNQQPFFRIVLEQIEKKTIVESSTFYQPKKKLCLSKIQNPKDDPFNIEDNSFQSEKEQNQGSSAIDDIAQNLSFDSINSEKTFKEEKQKMVMQTSSINSSLKTQDLVHLNNRFIEICFKLFKNPSDINDQRLKYYTINSSLLSIILSIFVMIAGIILKLNLLEVKDIFFADGAVSDNMQLTQFMFNRAMNSKLFIDNHTHVEFIINSAQFQRDYLYNLLVLDLRSFISTSTSMTNTRFYQFIKVPVLWSNSTDLNNSLEIDSNQFLLFYNYLSMKVQKGIQNGSVTALQQVQQSLRLMKVNFPQLKRINHYNLFLYKQMSDKSLDLASQLFIYMQLVHLALSILIFVLFYRQKMFRRHQQVEGYSIYKIIPSKIIELLANYYSTYAQQNKTQKDLIKYQNQFYFEGLQLSPDNKAFYKPNKSVFVTNNFKSPLAVWKMFFAILIINLLFAVFIIRISRLVQPFKAMMNNINQLMDSENYLLQAYFDLKANFLIDDEMNLSTDFYENLLSSQKESEVIFNKISVQSLTLFTNYDSKFQSEFIGLLINDVCELAAWDISQVEDNKCKKFFKLKFLQNGVSMGMNYFTRIVRQTIQEIKQKVKNQIELNLSTKQIKTNIVQNFKNSPQFKEVDESIFFMFKLFQGTQTRIFNSLESTIEQSMFLGFILIGIQIGLIGIIYPISLIINFKQQKFQLSKLYVSFLLIPSPVSQFIKTFSDKIHSIVQYND